MYENDLMRNYILNVAQSLSDEKLLRMLYVRAKNLKAIDEQIRNEITEKAVTA